MIIKGACISGLPFFRTLFVSGYRSAQFSFSRVSIRPVFVLPAYGLRFFVSRFARPAFCQDVLVTCCFFDQLLFLPATSTTKLRLLGVGNLRVWKKDPPIPPQAVSPDIHY
jgi:hypothetical protein